MVEHEDKIWVGTDGQMFLIDVKTFQIINTWLAHSGLINDIITVGKTIWSCSNDFSIAVWDSSNIEETQNISAIKKLQGHSSKVHCLLNIGKFVLSGSFDLSIIIWDSQVFFFYFFFLIFLF